jgi:hypothetical protein
MAVLVWNVEKLRFATDVAGIAFVVLESRYGPAGTR